MSRLLLALIFVVCTITFALSEPRSPAAHFPFTAACKDVLSGEKLFSEFPRYITQHGNFLQDTQDVKNAPPYVEGCDYKGFIGTPMLKIFQKDVRWNGRLVRIVFFIAYDVTRNRSVYSVTDFLLPDRLALNLAPSRGLFFAPRVY